MDTPIVSMLDRVSKETRLRFCMPGHKGKKGFLSGTVNAQDITELPGADNLYCPQGFVIHSFLLIPHAGACVLHSP